MNIVVTEFVQDPTYNDRQYGREDGKKDRDPTDLRAIISGSDDYAQKSV